MVMEVWYIFIEDQEDVLFSSKTIARLRGKLDYGTRTMTLRNSDDMAFEIEWADMGINTMTSATGVFAAQRTVVPARSQTVIPVQISQSVWAPRKGTWGLIGNINPSIIVAKGITEIAPRGLNWVQVLNPSGSPMIIPMTFELSARTNWFCVDRHFCVFFELLELLFLRPLLH